MPPRPASAGLAYAVITDLDTVRLMTQARWRPGLQHGHLRPGADTGLPFRLLRKIQGVDASFDFAQGRLFWPVMQVPRAEWADSGVIRPNWSPF